MEERLIVKNFGPLKDVDIPLKDLMVFIGPQGSGKSTIAKLLAIFNDKLSDGFFPNFLKNYGIDWLKTDSCLDFKYDGTEVSFKNQGYKGWGLRFLFPDLMLQSIEEDVANKINLARHNSLNYRNTFGILNDQVKIIYTDIAKFYENSVPSDLENKFSGILNWINKCYESIKKDADYLKNKEFQLTLLSNLQSFGRIIEFLRGPLIVYMPSERSILSGISGSFFSFKRYDIPISNVIIAFGAEFEKARKIFPEYSDPILGVKFVYTGLDDRIYFNEIESIQLSEAASGIQTLLPMLLVIEALEKREKNESYLFIIEEPELNLYPTAQKKLVDFLVKKCTTGNNKLIITTHSPYILTALNNHIEASEAAKNNKVEPSELEKVMPKESWLDFDRVGAFYVDSGTCKDIMDYEERLILAEQIDSASDEINDEFDKLSSLKYKG